MLGINLDSIRGQIYIGSDFHLFHDKQFLLKPRGFSRIDDHDALIIDDLMALNEEDCLIYLGDFALSGGQNTSQKVRQEVAELLQLIRCKVYYLWGNHESYVYPIYEKAIEEFWLNSCATKCIQNADRVFREIYPFDVGNVTFLGDAATFRYGKTTFQAQHFAPYLWDRCHHGRICFSGHSHSSCEPLNSSGYQIGRVFDVGVENAINHYKDMAFFTLQDAIEIVKQKPVIQKDHHNKETN